MADFKPSRAKLPLDELEEPGVKFPFDEPTELRLIVKEWVLGNDGVFRIALEGTAFPASGAQVRVGEPLSKTFKLKKDEKVELEKARLAQAKDLRISRRQVVAEDFLEHFTQRPGYHMAILDAGYILGLSDQEVWDIFGVHQSPWPCGVNTYGRVARQKKAELGKSAYDEALQKWAVGEPARTARMNALESEFNTAIRQIDVNVHQVQRLRCSPRVLDSAGRDGRFLWSRSFVWHIQ